MADPAAQQHPLPLTQLDLSNVRACAGYAWLARHRPHLVPEEAMQVAARRDRERQHVVAIARAWFPGAITIETSDVDTAVSQTREAIDGGATILFDATVCTAAGLLARADVLTRDDSGWTLHEVRATTTIKREHIADAAYQAVAFAGAGLDLTRVRLVTLRKVYRRQGEPHPDSLCQSTDITARVRRRLAPARREVARALETVRDPQWQPMCLCDMGTRSQRCPTFEHFHPDLPRGGTVYDLGGISGDLLGKAIARGVVDLAGWPDDLPLSLLQRRQVETVRTRRPYLDRDAVRDFLGRLAYPLHFLDYETFQTAVPRFDGCRPWAQVPFQYSLHVVESDGATCHRRFLWTERDAFPVPDLLARLRADIGPHGSVVVWNRGFEQSRNREMAELRPEFAPFLHDVNARTIDLMDIVRLGAWVHPEFNGSASIKKVIPVVDPALSYDRLPIGDGALAAERWHTAVFGEPGAMTDEERAAIFAALDSYCHLDTLAMLRILRHLEALLGDAGAIMAVS